jgi:predicted RNA-binding Zn-ribbon protein involved in translation (DUF1610 family)
MDASQKECPQCGYDYMEFYESLNTIRYNCPDCGHIEEVEKERREKESLWKRKSQ